MARAFIGKAEAERLRSHKPSSTVQQESICSRCGGLMVGDFCIDLLNSTGELEFAASRCVQCGEVVDPVILQNRQLRQSSKPGRFAVRMTSVNGMTGGH